MEKGNTNTLNRLLGLKIRTSGKAISIYAGQWLEIASLRLQ